MARRLVAASPTAPDPHVPEAMAVTEKLRITLTKFAGADGFASLLRPALTLARAEVPSLQTVEIGTDGRLTGLEQLFPETGSGTALGEAAVAITAQLLELLVTFIGEPLTLALVRDAWPDVSLDELPSTRETDS